MFDDLSRTRISCPHVIWRAGDDEISNGDVGRRVVDLIQETNRQLRGVGDATTVRRQSSCEDAQQGGLSRSVAAYDAHHVAAAQPEAEVIEQRTGAVAHRDA